ncbi:hypothetical protein GQF01_01675 [Paenibacillus sp. 5J-6]|uniref:Uncharacterized protein n=1 Tax=Paenibacillus silvestris TaxID=2606219 RepID=A0A6L8US42_9BACL|nr:hypothetical protein [Paenibacillus silvestris]
MNFQGNLAELRHANREAEKLDTEDWDMDRLEGKKQEVDINLIFTRAMGRYSSLFLFHIIDDLVP